jgi:hypothetical protein
MVHPAVLEAAEHHGMASDPWEEQAVAEHFGQPAEPPHLREIDPGTARRDLAIAEHMAAAERGEMSYDAGTGQGPTPVLGGVEKSWEPRGPVVDLRRDNRSESIHATAALPMAGQYAADRPVYGAGATVPYDATVGPGFAPRVGGPLYQARGRDVGAGYLNNPLTGEGRTQIGRQFWNAPLGGHVRAGLDGQEIFGHTIDRDQALMAERGLAGLLATGVGVPAFMAAVQQLTTPADQNTIPL